MSEFYVDGERKAIEGPGDLERILAELAKAELADAWFGRSEGSSLHLLIARERAVLVHRASPADAGATACSTREPGGASQTPVEFTLAGGRIEAWPLGWTVSRAEALDALRRFAGTGERPAGLDWQPPRYRSFISYSHMDEEWARWLHRALERYRVPSRLVGRETARGTVPRRLYPIFRDRDEMSSSPDLAQEIAFAVKQTHSLLVICSPYAAASLYVREEIERFRRLGGEDRIFCLIVGGEPNASERPELGLPEAFPEPLRFKLDRRGTPTRQKADPLAADVRPGKETRADARLKLVAGMLGIGFDELKRRDARRRARQRLQLTAVAVAVVATILGVWWNRQRALEVQRQIALAQRLVDQSVELFQSEHPFLRERALLLTVESLRRLDELDLDYSRDAEAAQARLRADGALRATMGLFYSPAMSLRSEIGPEYTDRGFETWTAEAVAFGPGDGELTAVDVLEGTSGTPYAYALKRWRLDTGEEVLSGTRGLDQRRFSWPSRNRDPGTARHFALSPEGRFLAIAMGRGYAGYPDTLRVLEASSGRDVARLPYVGNPVAVAVSPNAEFVALGTEGYPADRTVMALRVWHTASGRLLPGTDGVASVPRALAFSPDGRYLASAGAAVRVWRIDDDSTGVRLTETDWRFQHQIYDGDAVAFSRDSRHLAASGRPATAWIVGGEATEFGEKLVRVWAVGDWQPMHDVPHRDALRSLALGRDAAFLAINDAAESLQLMSLGSGAVTRIHYAHMRDDGGVDIDRSRSANLSGRGPSWRGELAAAAFSPDGRYLVMAGRTDPVVWRISGGGTARTMRHDRKVFAVSFDPGSTVLTTLSGEQDRLLDPGRHLTLREWDVASGQERDGALRDLVADEFAFSRDGRFLALAADDDSTGHGGSARVLSGRTEVASLRYEGRVERIALSPDGRLLAVASVLDAPSSDSAAPALREVRIRATRPGPDSIVFRFSTRARDVGGASRIELAEAGWFLQASDAIRLESGGVESRTRFWEMRTGREMEYDDVPEVVREAWSEDRSVTPDGSHFAWEDTRGVVHVAETSGGNELVRIDLPLGAYEGLESRLASWPVTLSPSATWVAAVADRVNVHVWPLEPRALIDAACALASRRLDEVEWSQYLPDERVRTTCPDRGAGTTKGS